MAKFHFAKTARINPPGSTPVLTAAQVWAGLQRKIRYPQEFLAVVESCKIIRDEDGVVEREMKFRPGQGPGKETLRETVVGYEPSWVDFRMEDGTFVRNIISELGNDGDEGLYLTYKFEYHFPELDPQSKEGKEKLAHLKEMAQNAVEGSVEVIREMVKDGRVPA